MTQPQRRLAHVTLLSLLVTLALVLVRGAALPAPARAEACPGSGGALACPYASAAIVGQRAEAILRFPEAVALDTSGNVYVADQLSYVVQKFSAAGDLSRRVGLLRWRPRPVRPDRRARHRRRRQCLRRRLQPQPHREVRLLGELPYRLGPHRRRSRAVQVRFLPELHQAPRRRHRGGGRIRVRRRLRQQPHRAIQPLRRRTDPVGLQGRAAPASSPTRAASPPPRPRCSSPTTTTIASSDSARAANTRARSAPTVRTAVSSDSPTASRWTPPATCTSPTTSTTASSS